MTSKEEHEEAIRLAMDAMGLSTPVSLAMTAIDNIEEAMRALPEAKDMHLAPGEVGMGRVTPPVVHDFAPGIYRRRFTSPAMCLVVSAIHAQEHFFVVTTGRVRVCGINGGKVNELEDIVAPYHGRTMPFTRRVLFFLEETEWTTYHVTDETDVQKILDYIIIPRDRLLITE